MERSRVKTAAPLAAIVALAALLRLYKITAFALWFDESVSVALISRSWSHMWSRVADDIGPPLYFVVLKMWCSVFGQSLLTLRSLSVVFSVAAVWFGYRFVQTAFRDSRLALLAALLLAVNPFQIQYARETRMYAMGVCLVLISSVLLVRALRAPRRVTWIAYGAAAAACVYTHYYLAFAIAAQAIVVAAMSLRAEAGERRALLRSAALGYTSAAALFAPWVPVLLMQMRRVQHDFWVPRLTVDKVLRVPWTLLLGGSDSEWTSAHALVAAAVLMLAILAVTAWKAEGWPTWLVIGQAVLPISAGLALSIDRPIFVDRYFLFASAFWSILLALIIWHVNSRARRAAVAALVVVFTAAMFARNLNAIGLVSIHHPAPKPGMAGAAALVNTRAEPADAVVVAHSLIYFSFAYYNRTGIAPRLYSLVPLPEIAYYAGHSVLDPGDMIYDLRAIAGPRRVWYLWTDGFYQQKSPVPSGWRLTTTQAFEDTPGYKGSIHVDEYIVPPAAPCVSGC